MKRAKRASPELDIRFDASVVSEYDLERWADAVFDELYNRLSRTYETGKYDSVNLKQIIMTEVDKRIGNLLEDLEGDGSKIVVIVKKGTPEGYLCEIMTPSNFYISIVNMLDKALSEKLLGEAEEVEIDTWT